MTSPTRLSFEQLTALLDELSEKEIVKRDDWPYINMRRTVSFFLENGKKTITISYPFRYNVEKAETIWASTKLFSFNYFWYEFTKNIDGVEKFSYAHKRFDFDPEKIEKETNFHSTNDGTLTLQTQEDIKAVKKFMKTGGRAT